MGNDAPLACLSEHPQMVFDYFKQLFAQVRIDMEHWHGPFFASALKSYLIVTTSMIVHS